MDIIQTRLPGRKVKGRRNGRLEERIEEEVWRDDERGCMISGTLAVTAVVMSVQLSAKLGQAN